MLRRFGRFVGLAIAIIGFFLPMTHAEAAGIMLLPARAGNFKTIIIRTVTAGEWLVRADFTVTNPERTDLIWCALWGNPRESGLGDQRWRRLDYDQVWIGLSLDRLDATIHLEAAIDSLRRFQVKVQCGHNISGIRPFVEPDATLRIVRNLNA